MRHYFKTKRGRDAKLVLSTIRRAKQMIRLLPLILIAALVTGCSKPNSERIRTTQLSCATVMVFAS